MKFNFSYYAVIYVSFFVQFWRQLLINKKFSHEPSLRKKRNTPFSRPSEWPEPTTNWPEVAQREQKKPPRKLPKPSHERVANKWCLQCDVIFFPNKNLSLNLKAIWFQTMDGINKSICILKFLLFQIFSVKLSAEDIQSDKRSVLSKKVNYGWGRPSNTSPKGCPAQKEAKSKCTLA